MISHYFIEMCFAHLWLFPKQFVVIKNLCFRPKLHGKDSYWKYAHKPDA